MIDRERPVFGIGMGRVLEAMPAVPQAEALGDGFAGVGEVERRARLLMGLPCFRARERLLRAIPEQMDRPAGIWLAGVEFPLRLEGDCARQFTVHQGVGHGAGVGELRRARGPRRSTPRRRAASGCSSALPPGLP